MIYEWRQIKKKSNTYKAIEVEPCLPLRYNERDRVTLKGRFLLEGLSDQSKHSKKKKVSVGNFKNPVQYLFHTSLEICAWVRVQVNFIVFQLESLRYSLLRFNFCLKACFNGNSVEFV